jgi:hypothetical protein
MRLLKVALCAVIAGLTVSAWSQAPGRTPKVTIFSAPNAGTGANQGTYAFGITANGTVAGYFADKNDVHHGFIRTLDGTLTVFDVPEAGTGPGQGTEIEAMNSKGDATGWYFAADGMGHPYLRTAKGKVTLFDVPDSMMAGGSAITDGGVIVGGFWDLNWLLRGFVRSQTGEISTFDMPRSRPGAWNEGTQPWYSTNQSSASIGFSWDEDGWPHGWIRTPQGLVNEFNASGVSGTWPYGINPQGAITGILVDENWGMHGFVRDVHGNYTMFDVPGSENGGGTGPEVINAAGTVIGNYWDPTGNNHGFIRAADGTFKVFDLPGGGKGNYQGTLPGGMNAQGWIVGQIVDDNMNTKSFVMIP